MSTTEVSVEVANGRNLSPINFEVILALRKRSDDVMKFWTLIRSSEQPLPSCFAPVADFGVSFFSQSPRDFSRSIVFESFAVCTRSLIIFPIFLVARGGSYTKLSQVSLATT